MFDSDNFGDKLPSWCAGFILQNATVSLQNATVTNFDSTPPTKWNANSFFSHQPAFTCLKSEIETP